MRKIHVFLGLLFLAINSQADGILVSWGPNELYNMSKDRFEAAKSWTIKEIIEKNLKVDEWPEVYLLGIASKAHKESIYDSLIGQLDNIKQVKLKNTRSLIIWERITLGDIVFEGKGLQVNDDLFSVAGRANWILRNLSGKNFGFVKPNSTIQDLKLLKAKWIDWRQGKNVKYYIDPYETKEKGLSEIRSVEALEAIITSLKNTPEKEKIIKECLKSIYGLNDLPDDPNAPASFCNPDTYSNIYLMELTGTKEKHDYKWWSNWWFENKDKLVWNKKKGQFKIKE